jgi:hypothetical protein
MLKNSLAIIEQFKRSLDEYTIDQLRYKCKEDVWSIGQMYIHVIEVAEEYIEHFKHALWRHMKSLEVRLKTVRRRFPRKHGPMSV